MDPALLGAAPSGVAYTAVLVCHVAAALGGMVGLTAGVVSAARLLRARGGAVPASVRAYFAPGTNWAGRVLWLVPVFGAALLAMSGGDYGPGQVWVVAGIGMWAGAVALCEGVQWRAERRIRAALRGIASDAAAPPEVLVACRVVCVSGSAALAVLVAAMVVMTAKP